MLWMQLEIYGLQTAACDSRSAADAAHCGMLHTVDDAATCPVYAVEGCGLWSAADDLDDAGCCVCCVGMLRDAMVCCESCG